MVETKKLHQFCFGWFCLNLIYIYLVKKLNSIYKKKLYVINNGTRSG